MEQQQISEQADLEETFNGLLEFVDEPTAGPGAESTSMLEEPEIFYLWDTKVKVFEVFKVLRSYFLEDYRFDSALLLKMIEHKGLDLEEALLDLSFIRQGFVNKLPKGT